MPMREMIKKQSAVFSRRFSFFSSFVLIEMKEKTQENVNRTATTEVSSSIKCVSVWLAMCSEVITNRQKPRRFAAVFKIC